MKIAVVEDERAHALLLESYIREWAAQKHTDSAVQKYENAEAFLFAWEEEKDFSAVFLDIQMRGMDGVALAHRIRQDSGSVGIVFATGMDEFVQEGYEVSAIHYLLKPLAKEKVWRCLDRIFQGEKKEGSLVWRTPKGVERAEAGRIWWVGAMGHDTLVGMETAQGVAEKTVYKSFGQLEKELSGDERFVKCHRCYLVNLAHVCRVEKTDVVMDGGEKIPLSRRMYQEMNRRFIDFFAE